MYYTHKHKYKLRTLASTRMRARTCTHTHTHTHGTLTMQKQPAGRSRAADRGRGSDQHSMSPGRLGYRKRASGKEGGTAEAPGCRTRGPTLWEATVVMPPAPYGVQAPTNRGSS